MLPLRSAINQAKQQNKTVRKTNIRIERNGKRGNGKRGNGKRGNGKRGNGKRGTIDLEVIPLKNPRERCF